MNPWEILGNVGDLHQICTENDFAKENQAGAVVGGGAALVAGVTFLGAAALGPVAIPLIMVGGAMAGATAESTVKNVGKGVAMAGATAGSTVKNVGKGVSKGITGFFDFFKSDEDFFNRGIEKLESGEYGAALEDFTKAIELNSQNVYAYFVRGCILDEQHNYAGAISDYTKTIQLDPSYVDAYRNRGNIYVAKNDYTKAIADYTQVIKLAPGNADIYLIRGSAYTTAGASQICNEYKYYSGQSEI